MLLYYVILFIYYFYYFYYVIILCYVCYFYVIICLHLWLYVLHVIYVMLCYVMLCIKCYVLNVIYLSNLMGGKPGHKQREKLYNQYNNSAFYSTFLYNRDENMLMFFTAIDNQFTGINSFLVCGN